MTSRSQQTEICCWLLPFLPALIAALAAILLGTTASARAAAVTENRVGAFNVAGGVLVEAPQHITPGQQLGNDVAGPVFVVATGVAAEGRTTRVFRVEGPGNARLGIDGTGNVSIQGDQTV